MTIPGLKDYIERLTPELGGRSQDQSYQVCASIDINSDGDAYIDGTIKIVVESAGVYNKWRDFSLFKNLDGEIQALGGLQGESFKDIAYKDVDDRYEDADSPDAPASCYDLNLSSITKGEYDQFPGEDVKVSFRKRTYENSNRDIVEIPSQSVLFSIRDQIIHTRLLEENVILDSSWGTTKEEVSVLINPRTGDARLTYENIDSKKKLNPIIVKEDGTVWLQNSQGKLNPFVKANDKQWSEVLVELRKKASPMFQEVLDRIK